MIDRLGTKRAFGIAALLWSLSTVIHALGRGLWSFLTLRISLGLTEAQPENNVQRIVLEMLGVTMSKRARARSVQLPAWNEALGLPRPWDQQWSLRMQQVLAFETDLLEYDDLFDGSHVVEAKTAELRDAAQAELDDVLSMGGAFEAVDTLKSRLVASMAERTRRIEAGEQTVVGVNDFVESAESPLEGDESILTVDPAVGDEMVADVSAWRCYKLLSANIGRTGYSR